MRPVLVSVLALSVLVLVAVVGHAETVEVHGAVPAWALFSFAVSAFRGPLR